jgi:hypothetical protein
MRLVCVRGETVAIVDWPFIGGDFTGDDGLSGGDLILSWK